MSVRSSSDIDVLLVVASIRAHWRAIAAGLVVGMLAAATYLLIADRIYRVDVVVTSTADDEQSPLSGLAGALGGLSALGGELLGNANLENESIALLHSKTIAMALISRNDLIPILFEEKWHSENDEWQVSADDIPTMADAVERLHEDVIRVRRDRELGLITISAYWRNKELASDWAMQMISLVNEKMRRQAIDEATQSLAYLAEELEKSQNVEARQMISQLMQSKLNNSAMASAKREYAFRIIDPAILPDDDDYVRPNVILAVVGSTLLGMILGFT
ncbi:MAG TPA: Wzz/FepE/Etk N-terminal domain-containing protein, partial [Woeseiaceae bacterium]|nr:Wzz/FepE/Etk N-terminal domain-containing protein [Woeseiaceae bacterium]